MPSTEDELNAAAIIQALQGELQLLGPRLNSYPITVKETSPYLKLIGASGMDVAAPAYRTKTSL